MGLVSFVDLHWMLAPVAERTCIKGGFHDVHALFHIIVHSVHARCLIKCLFGIFSLVWTLMSTKLWSFSCFLIRNMFGSLVVYLTHLTPHVHFPCIGHVYLIFCSILFYLLFELYFSFISCPYFSLTFCLFVSKRGIVYSRVIYRRVLSFLYDSCAHS